MAIAIKGRADFPSQAAAPPALPKGEPSCAMTSLGACRIRRGAGTGPETESIIQIHNILCILLNIFLARLDLFAHEEGEDLIGLDGVLEADLLEGALFGVHGGLPQLVGVHLAEAL